MKHYLLFYSFVSDYLERRAALRDAHLALAWECADRGELLLGGALANPVDCGLLLFRSKTAEAAETFAKTDPYVTNGLVTSWHVREWTTVVGPEASRPVKP